MSCLLKTIYKFAVTLPAPTTSFIRLTPPQTPQCPRFYSNGGGLKVTVVGAAGRVGQCVSLMLKQSPLIEELCLYDLKPTCGMAMELNHIDTKCRVTAYSGKSDIDQALERSKIVVVVAAAPKSKKLPADKRWEVNAPVVSDIIAKFANSCPKAFLALASGPLNSTLPLASEILRKCGCYNQNTIFGVTSIDVIRANTFVAQIQGLEPECVMVPVIGGHTEETIVPVLSQATPPMEFTNDELDSITKGVRRAFRNLIKSSNQCNPFMAEAFAIARFVISLAKGINGTSDIVECAFVPSTIYEHVKYLATPLLLGQHGIAKNLGVPKLTQYEKCQLDKAIRFMRKDADRAMCYLRREEPKDVCDVAEKNPARDRCDENHCAVSALAEKTRKD